PITMPATVMRRHGLLPSQPSLSDTTAVGSASSCSLSVNEGAGTGSGSGSGSTSGSGSGSTSGSGSGSTSGSTSPSAGASTSGSGVGSTASTGAGPITRLAARAMARSCTSETYHYRRASASEARTSLAIGRSSKREAARAGGTSRIISASTGP